MPNGVHDSKLDFALAKDVFEKEYIIHALKTNKGRINQTALNANIPKKTLLRKIEKYEIFSASGEKFQIKINQASSNAYLFR